MSGWDADSTYIVQEERRFICAKLLVQLDELSQLADEFVAGNHEMKHFVLAHAVTCELALCLCRGLLMLAVRCAVPEYRLKCYKPKVPVYFVLRLRILHASRASRIIVPLGPWHIFPFGEFCKQRPVMCSHCVDPD